MGWDWQGKEDWTSKDQGDWHTWKGSDWQSWKGSSDWSKKRVKEEWGGSGWEDSAKRTRWENKSEPSWSDWQEGRVKHEAQVSLNPNADQIPRTPPDPVMNLGIPHTPPIGAGPVPPTPAGAFGNGPVPPTPAGAFGSGPVPPTPAGAFGNGPVPPTPAGAFGSGPVPPTPAGAFAPAAPGTPGATPFLPHPGTPVHPGTPGHTPPTPGMPPAHVPASPGTQGVKLTPATPVNPSTPMMPGTPAARAQMRFFAPVSGLSTPVSLAQGAMAAQSRLIVPLIVPGVPGFTGSVSAGDLRHAPRRRNGKMAPAPAIKAKVNRLTKDLPRAGSGTKKTKEAAIPDFKTWVKNKKPIELRDEQPVKTETPVPLQPGATTPGLPGALTPGQDEVAGMTPGFAGGEVTPFLDQPAIAPGTGIYGSLYGLEEGGVTPPQLTGMTPGFAEEMGAATPLLSQQY